MSDHARQVVKAVQEFRFQWRLYFLNILAGFIGGSRTALDIVYARQPSWSCMEGAGSECERALEDSPNYIPCRDNSPFSEAIIDEEGGNYFLMSFKLLCKDDHLTWSLPLASSFFFLGTLFGGVVWGMISDRWGRLRTIKIASICALLTALVTLWSPALPVYTLARCIDGFCFGGYSLSCLILTIEYAIPERRWLHVLAYFLMWGPGMALMNSVYIASNMWRVVGAVSVALVLLFVVAVHVLAVESAPWAAIAYSELSLRYRAILDSIAKIINCETATEGLFRRSRSHLTSGVLLQKDQLRQILTPLLVLLLLWLTAALTYYLRYYDVYLTQNSGSSPLHLPFTSLLFLASLDNLLGFVGGALICFRLPRRQTLLATCCAAAIAAFLQLIHEPYTQLVSQHLYTLLSGALFAQLYLVTVELTPVSHRAFLAGLCFGVSRIGAVITPHLASLQMRELPNLVAGAALLGSAVAVVLALPETRNKPTIFTFSQFVKYRDGLALEESSL